MRTERDPRDKFEVSETEVVNVVRVGVVRDPDFLISVASDDELAARTQSKVEEHGKVSEQANSVARLVNQVKLEEIAAFI